MISRLLGILLWPTREWKAIGNLADERLKIYLPYAPILAIIPTVAWYYGTTQVGWSIGDSDVIRLTADSARKIGGVFYITTLCCIAFIGFIIHWMSETYGAHTSILRGVVVSGFISTPILLAGAAGFVPSLAFDLLVGIAAVSFAVYLLYTGIPLAMNVPPDRGFFYASAIIAVFLVMIVAVLAAMLILWEMGFAPEFTD